MCSSKLRNRIVWQLPIRGKKNTVYYLPAASKWIVTLYLILVCSKILRTKMLWHSLFVFHFSCLLFELACIKSGQGFSGLRIFETEHDPLKEIKSNDRTRTNADRWWLWLKFQFRRSTNRITWRSILRDALGVCQSHQHPAHKLIAAEQTHNNFYGTLCQPNASRTQRAGTLSLVRL